MEDDGIRAYLRWAWAQSTHRWGGRASVYIALFTYALAVVGIIAALVFGKWSDEIDLAFKWLVGALAIGGLLAFAFDFGIQTPRGLWNALKQHVDSKTSAITDFMSEGRRITDNIYNVFDKQECIAWESKVYDWLAVNQPDFKEQFRLDFVPGGQQASPYLENQDAANWLNTIQRRQHQLGRLLDHLRDQRAAI